jgi:hypothetical protein
MDLGPPGAGRYNTREMKQKMEVVLLGEKLKIKVSASPQM